MHDTRRVRLVLGVLLVAAIALITIDFRDGGTSGARGAGSGIFGPVERVASDVTSPVSSVFDWVTGGPGQRQPVDDGELGGERHHDHRAEDEEPPHLSLREWRRRWGSG